MGEHRSRSAYGDAQVVEELGVDVVHGAPPVGVDRVGQVGQNSSESAQGGLGGVESDRGRAREATKVDPRLPSGQSQEVPVALVESDGAQQVLGLAGGAGIAEVGDDLDRGREERRIAGRERGAVVDDHRGHDLLCVVASQRRRFFGVDGKRRQQSANIKERSQPAAKGAGWEVAGRRRHPGDLCLCWRRVSVPHHHGHGRTGFTDLQPDPRGMQAATEGIQQGPAHRSEGADLDARPSQRGGDMVRRHPVGDVGHHAWPPRAHP